MQTDEHTCLHDLITRFISVANVFRALITQDKRSSNLPNFRVFVLVLYIDISADGIRTCAVIYCGTRLNKARTCT